jgi:hypothetical protein
LETIDKSCNVLLFLLESFLGFHFVKQCRGHSRRIGLVPFPQLLVYRTSDGYPADQFLASLDAQGFSAAIANIRPISP